MKKLIAFVAVLIVVIIAALWFMTRNQGSIVSSPTPSPTPTASPTPAPQSVSDGTITFSYGSDYGLATTPQQVLVTAYIPPFDPSFNYCLYYNGTAYQGTNFESAGLRIQKRADLKTQSKCLSTQPLGYTGLVPTTANGPDYATAVFSPLSDAGAGHYANGALYRLWFGSSCYEFETRIGQTQFANYPAGSIQQFTGADQDAVNNELQGIVNNITLSNGEKVSFPQPSPAPTQS